MIKSTYSLDPVCTPSNQGFTYGLFEIRCKLPQGDTWPAFWLYGDGTEIDIFEGASEREFSNNVIYNGSPQNYCSHTLNYTKSWNDLSTEFHTYSAVWTPYEVTFFFDGREIRTVETSQVQTNNCPLFIIANLAMEVWSPTDNAHMDIDFIKVWKPLNNNYLTPFKSTNEWMHLNIISNSGAKVPMVHSDEKSISIKNENHLFYRSTSNLMYEAKQSSWGQWTIAKINYNWNVPMPACEVRGDVVYHPSSDMIIYKGGDNRLQFFKKDNNNQYYHWWIDDNFASWTSSNGVNSASNSVTVLPNGNIAYRGADNKIHIYINSSNGWIHSIPSHIYSFITQDYVAGDIICNNSNDIFYKGVNGKIYKFTYTPSGYQHSCLSPSNAQTISSQSGSLQTTLTEGILYIGSDNKIYKLFPSGNSYISSLIPHTYNNNLGMVDADKVLGGINWNETNKRLYYRGFDGRIQSFSKIGSTWEHSWIDDYWNTEDFSTYNINNSTMYPSINSAANGTLFYTQKTGFLQRFQWGPCEITNPTCGTASPLKKILEQTAPTLSDIHDASLKIRPNPVVDYLIVDLDGFSCEGDCIYQIVDMSGKILQESRLTAEAIDCSYLPAGIYAFRIYSPNFVSDAIIFSKNQ